MTRQQQQGQQQARPQQQQRGAPPAQTRAGGKWGMNSEQLDLLRRTVAKGLTDDEFALYMTVAQRTGLDPFRRQIHAFKRFDSMLGRKAMAIVVGIDGYRHCASRTGEDDGQRGPFWCGADRQWRDVWLDPEPPRAAKVFVYRRGRRRPYSAVALWDSYVQTEETGEPVTMWRKHGPGQLAKCAEALALRKAFPAELSGTHTHDELGADAVDAPLAEHADDDIASSPTAGSAASTATLGAESTATGAPKPLSEEEMTSLREELAKCESRAAVTALGHRVAKSGATEAQRERLRVAFEGQLADIDRISAEAKGGAEGKS
jgi:phage recombination protein Bet